MPSYTAAKSGVAGLTRLLANEWAQYGITVNAIAPGYMATNNTAPLRADPARSAEILGPHPAGPLGAAGGSCGAGGVPGLGRRGLRHRARAGGGWRLARTLSGRVEANV